MYFRLSCLRFRIEEDKLHFRCGLHYFKNSTETRKNVQFTKKYHKSLNKQLNLIVIKLINYQINHKINSLSN